MMALKIPNPTEVGKKYGGLVDRRRHLEGKHEQIISEGLDRQNKGLDRFDLARELPPVESELASLRYDLPEAERTARVKAAAALVADAGYRRLVVDAAVAWAERLETWLPLYAVIRAAGEVGVKPVPLPPAVEMELKTAAAWCEAQVRQGALAESDVPEVLRGLTKVPS